MTTNITVPNGAASPVNKTFSVSRSAAGDESAVLHLREGVSQAAYPKLEFSSKNAQAVSGRGRGGVVTLVTPYGYTDTNGNWVKQDVISTTVRTTTPDSAPDAVRKDHAAFIAGLLADTQLKGLVITGYSS